jgi:hypothetical protein
VDSAAVSGHSDERKIFQQFLGQFGGPAFARREVLEKLHAELQPRLRLSASPTTNARVLRAALAELREAIAFFNQRWLTFMGNLDLQKLNLLRDDYNRFYVMEKECALGSVRVARQGFRKLDPLRLEDFLAVLPLLPVP